MKRIFFSLAALLWGFALHASAEGRRIESFNYGWRFVLEMWPAPSNRNSMTVSGVR